MLCEQYKILPAYAFWAKSAVFRALGEFVPGWVCDGGCWESFVPGRAFSDAVGFKVMTSLCSGREIVRPASENGLKTAVYGVLGEFFRARAQMGVLGE